LCKYEEASDFVKSTPSLVSGRAGEGKPRQLNPLKCTPSVSPLKKGGGLTNKKNPYLADYILEYDC